MVQDNSSFQLNNQSYYTKNWSASVYFEYELEKLPEPDWTNKKRKYRCLMLIKEDHKNTTAWQIESWEKLFIEIDRNPNRVMKIIVNMRTIYIKYLN